MRNTVNRWNGLGTKTPRFWTNGTSRLKRDPKGALAKNRQIGVMCTYDVSISLIISRAEKKSGNWSDTLRLLFRHFLFPCIFKLGLGYSRKNSSNRSDFSLLFFILTFPQRKGLWNDAQKISVKWKWYLCLIFWHFLFSRIFQKSRQVESEFELMLKKTPGYQNEMVQ